jgi:glycine dehydrogenase subunit 1
MSSPYIPNTDRDRAAMLHDIGAGSIEELFQDVPAKFRDARFNLPSPLTELELSQELRELSRQNASLDEYACFLGAGHYRHFVPAVVGHITGRSEFYTAYTPYQAEASQGILQAIYEYQSLVCQLTGMDISNAGMYDGASAAAEAALMAVRITGRKEVAVLSTVNPAYREVIGTYVSGQDITVNELGPGFREMPDNCACLLVPQPNFFGYLEKVTDYARLAHDAGALFIAIFDPISLGLLPPPGDYGADIAVAEGRPLGSPLNFGGPGLGIFTCRQEHLRQMPGRLVGRTTDVEGRPGYVLTMATREQHIRRERATSNICTNEALVALAATVYLAALGESGMRRVAELCYHKAHYTAEMIKKLKGYSLASESSFFKEFVIRCPVSPEKINRMLLKENIIGGLDVSHLVDNGMLLCVTEINSRQDIDRLVSVLKAL